MRHFLTALVALIFSLQGVSALGTLIEEDGVFRLNNLSDKFNLRADGALTNHWFNNIPGDEEYKLVADYRAELETGLWKLRANKNYEQTGSILARTEGFVLFDQEENFFADRLIDLPELFYRHDVELPGNNDAYLVFGKFNYRRFLDKDEISPDNYDIGERFHLGTQLNIGAAVTLDSLVNTNPLINVMNFQRGFDRPGAAETGAYGFSWGVHNNDRDSWLKDGWGYRGAIATHKLETFANTLAFSNELRKNWGTKYPGQFDFGYIYGNAPAFQIFDDDNGYLWYGSIVQNYKDFTPYVRWGTFNSSFGVSDFTINMITSGLFWQLGRKDVVGGHWTIFDSFFDRGAATDHVLRNIFVANWKHWFSDNINSISYLEFNIDQPKPLGPFGVLDSNWTIGFGLQGQI